MDPNDPPGTPFSDQPLYGPKQTHVCRVGRCVILTQGGRVTSESQRAISQFLEQHGPKEK